MRFSVFLFILTRSFGLPSPTKTQNTHSIIYHKGSLIAPLPDGLMWFVDGSSSKTETGATQTGYAIVQSPDHVIEAKSLPPHLSAQAAEIIALNRACELASGQPLTVYTDSQYPFSTVHCFAKQ
uniref:RNase H type-1 domain-containing protein n=1 Tax=Nothobranchius kadleci TaxID=1051664 RepID=A0A1A8BNU3_NOTKA